jgi:ferredoxin--NADP+ reductase
LQIVALRSYTPEVTIAVDASRTPSKNDIPLNLYRVSSPAVARVVSNQRLTPSDRDDVRHVVLDLSGLGYRYLEGQSLGVLVPGADPLGHRHKLRLYSIASSRCGDDGCCQSAGLCVKRVIYTDPVTDEEHRGVASNYLCDLKPGDEVHITGPAGATFLLPEDPDANLILVATGTGIAPFRAFLRRIYAELPRWNGQVRVFFGVRTEAECVYRQELEAYLERPGYQLFFAFSREQKTADGQRLYVQHRMAQCLDELLALFDQGNTYLYICGLKGMEKGIEPLFATTPMEGSAASSTSYQALRKAGRILIETY